MSMLCVALSQIAAWVIGCAVLLAVLCVAQAWMHAHRMRSRGSGKEPRNK